MMGEVDQRKLLGLLSGILSIWYFQMSRVMSAPSSAKLAFWTLLKHRFACSMSLWSRVGSDSTAPSGPTDKDLADLFDAAPELLDCFSKSLTIKSSSYLSYVLLARYSPKMEYGYEPLGEIPKDEEKTAGPASLATGSLPAAIFLGRLMTMFQGITQE